MRDEAVGIVPVQKVSQLNDGAKLQGPTPMKLFIPSYYEVLGYANSTVDSTANIQAEATAALSFQYAHYAKGADWRKKGAYWWVRSALAYTEHSNRFLLINANGGDARSIADNAYGVVPCFCF